MATKKPSTKKPKKKEEPVVETSQERLYTIPTADGFEIDWNKLREHVRQACTNQ
jgi:hypothetical protein